MHGRRLHIGVNAARVNHLYERVAREPEPSIGRFGHYRLIRGSSIRLGSIKRVIYLYRHFALRNFQPGCPVRCWDPKKPALCIEPERAVVIFDHGVDRRTGQAIPGIHYTQGAILPSIKPLTGSCPYRIVGIDRETVGGDNTLSVPQQNNSFRLAVAVAIKSAIERKYPASCILICGNDVGSMENVVHRDVFFYALVVDAKEPDLIECIDISQYPDIAFNIFGEGVSSPDVPCGAAI